MHAHNYLQIAVALLGVLSTILLFIVREQNNRINTVKNQLSEKKYSVYYEVYSIFFDLIKSQQQNDSLENNDDELVNRVVEIKKDLIIYAPDNIVKKYLEWNQVVTNNPTKLSHILLYLDLFILIRQDMGHKKTELNRQDILRSIMINDAEFEKMWRLINE